MTVDQTQAVDQAQVGGLAGRFVNDFGAPGSRPPWSSTSWGCTGAGRRAGHPGRADRAHQHPPRLG